MLPPRERRHPGIRWSVPAESPIGLLPPRGCAARKPGDGPRPSDPGNPEVSGPHSQNHPTPSAPETPEDCSLAGGPTADGSADSRPDRGDKPRPSHLLPRPEGGRRAKRVGPPSGAKDPAASAPRSADKKSIRGGGYDPQDARFHAARCAASGTKADNRTLAPGSARAGRGPPVLPPPTPGATRLAGSSDSNRPWLFSEERSALEAQLPKVRTRFFVSDNRADVPEPLAFSR